MDVTYSGEHSIDFTVVVNGLEVTKNSWNDFHLIPTTRPKIATGQPNYYMMPLVGTSKRLDITDFRTGGLTFGERAGSWTFYVDHTQWNGNWVAAYDAVREFLHGKEAVVSLTDDPDYMYEGILSVDDPIPDKSYSGIKIDYRFAYKPDNATRLYLSFTNSAHLEAFMYLKPIDEERSVNGSIEVDWGDGSARQILSADDYEASHNYASTGDYVVILTTPPGICIWFDGFADIGAYKQYVSDTLVRATIGGNTVFIGDAAFTQCFNLRGVRMANSVEEIASNAFYKCTRLSSVNLPRKVTHIGIAVFADCSSLTEIFIPKNIEEIERNAFGGSGITVYHFESRIPPEVYDANVWPSANVTMYIPRGSLSAYTNAPNYPANATYVEE